MDNLETVGGIESIDPLYTKQREDVAKMRASLLACSSNPSMTKVALRNISILRVYHQVNRIIRYLDMMDKLEEKLYKSIDYTIENIDIENNTTWIGLITIQERLQKNMIESQKLLAPYLKIEDFSIVDFAGQGDDQDNPAAQLMSASERDSLRTKAQTILKELQENA